jgi:hypothetical protein
LRDRGASDQIGDQDGGRRHGHDHERENERDREPTQPAGAGGHARGVCSEQGAEHGDLDSRDEPGRAQRFAVGLEDAQRNGDGGECRHRERDRPARLDGHRLLIRSRCVGHGCVSTQRKAERERIIRMG